VSASAVHNSGGIEIFALSKSGQTGTFSVTLGDYTNPAILSLQSLPTGTWLKFGTASNTPFEIYNVITGDGVHIKANVQFRSTPGTDIVPGIAFVGDNNTGFYQPATDEIGISLNGASILALNSTRLSLGAVIRVTPGTAATPAYSFSTGASSGMWYSTSYVNIAVAGINRFSVYPSGVSVIGEISVTEGTWGTGYRWSAGTWGIISTATYCIIENNGTGIAQFRTDNSDSFIRLGFGNANNRNAMIDFYANGAAPALYDARIIRNLGANGNFYIANEGTGAIYLQTAGTAALVAWSDQTVSIYNHLSVSGRIFSNEATGYSVFGPTTVVNVANGATLSLGNTNLGVMLIQNGGSGHRAFFIINGTSTGLWMEYPSTGGTFSSVASTAGKTNVYWVGTALTIQNMTGATRPYTIITLKY
jgi:hypothetical protein